VKSLRQLATAVFEERDPILQSWRDQVRTLPSARGLDVPTLNDHIPGWIGELAARLLTASNEADGAENAAAPLAHGLQRFEDGFDIEEVVAEYNILRDCVHELAERHDLVLRGTERRFVDRAFDDAIAAAVKAFAESQAQEAQRRRAEHLAFVAHDLRTPLHAITFATYLLNQRLESLAAEGEIGRLLKILGRNAKQLEGLVAQVLTENTQLLTELGIQVERRRFDLWPMAEALVQDLEPLATKTGTRVENQVPDDLELTADANLVRRILQNLVTNAITHAPGSNVLIGARDPGAGAPVECWVIDDGGGIPADRVGKVFDVLETDPKRDGAGLGLAIVKTFVEAHDGTVSVESVEGKGSTFRFTLPRAPVVRVPVQAKTAEPALER
jgi:two-component system, OmpR family, phosphate regulon sensor histidine kinase PhoR